MVVVREKEGLCALHFAQCIARVPCPRPPPRFVWDVRCRAYAPHMYAVQAYLRDTSDISTRMLRCPIPRLPLQRPSPPPRARTSALQGPRARRARARWSRFRFVGGCGFGGVESEYRAEVLGVCQELL